ncbi:tripartite motif-containing protein 3 [Oryzias melastigma]|nr:tripartite motif-containing protein 3 [Oryzias melastigma]
MVLCEDSDCSVCFFPYSRMDRIPRVLHCRHTFCELCLEAMQQLRSGYLMVSCPLCRQVTCIDRGLSLQEALWVDSEQWEQIAEDKGAEAGEDEEALRLEGDEPETKQRLSLQMECVSSRLRRKKLRLPTFFRKFSLTKQHQESIVPGSNVEMKSWRRLSTDF